MKVIAIGNGVAGNTAVSIIRQLESHADITIISEEVYPEYCACALPQYLAGELKRVKVFLRTKKDYSREGIKTIFGRKVTQVNPECKEVFLDNKSLTYDKLVIATGSKPIIPPIKGVNLDGVFSLKSLGDADQICRYPGRRAVVVGSGPVGVETSVALNKRGLKVYLVELLDRIMPRVIDETPSLQIRDILEEQGIGVLTGERVISIIGSGKVEGIVTNKHRIKCDMVILGAGMQPNTELAKESGLSIGPAGGISVNKQMMTNFSDVYACGDCVEAEDMITGAPILSLLWHNAKKQGEVVGYNCCGVPRRYLGSENITSLDIFGVHVASIGTTEEASSNEGIKVIERTSGKNYYRLIVSRGILIGAQSIGDARDMGALLCAMIRRDDLNKIKWEANRRDLLSLNPWYYGAARLWWM